MNHSLKTLFFLTVLAFSSSTFAAKVEKIQVQGNQRVEQSTIVEYLGVHVGDQYSAELKSKAVKNLFATSLFEDVNISFNNGVFKVKVQETPFVSKIVFTGNHKVKTGLLAHEIYTAPGESLRKARVRTDVEKIKEIYKRSGRFAVRVKSRLEPQENNRVKVIFDIEEGPKTGVKQIYFVGNDNYKDSELRSVVMTKESKWFRFLETNDTYDPDRIEYDKHLLKQFYNSVGFADFNVISVTADLLPTKEGFVITYSIEEGSKYKFGKFDLNNKLDAIDDKEVWKFIDNKQGQTFNLSAVNRMIDKMSNYLAGKGYPQVDIRPKLTPNRDTNIVDVTIVVDQAAKVFINQININGNLKTEDHVIRRQLKIAEGDVFNRGKIEQGERNIRNLDYFGKLDMRVEPTKKVDRYNLDIKVEEKSTASIGLDLGYNTSGGPFGRVHFSERNLVGTGKHLDMSVQAGKKSMYYQAGVTDPSFMDKDLSLGTSVFLSNNGSGSGFGNGEQNYSQLSKGAKVNAGYDVTDNLSHDVDYLIKKDSLKSSKASSSIFIKEQMGTFVTSAVGHGLTYDRVDNRYLPKNGYILSGTQEFAGVGGDTKYLKHELDTKFFKSFIENKFTLKFAASAGVIKGTSGKTVRISDRFNLGGHSLRGFANAGIGPRDKSTKEGLGGEKYYSLSTELSFPVGLPEEFNVTGAVFMDAGALWDASSKISTGFHDDKAPRASVGFGVLWVTRVAPIRLDWGFPIRKKKYDETETFHIKFTTSI